MSKLLHIQDKVVRLCVLALALCIWANFTNLGASLAFAQHEQWGAGDLSISGQTLGGNGVTLGGQQLNGAGNHNITGSTLDIDNSTISSTGVPLTDSAID